MAAIYRSSGCYVTNFYGYCTGIDALWHLEKCVKVTADFGTGCFSKRVSHLLVLGMLHATVLHDYTYYYI